MSTTSSSPISIPSPNPRAVIGGVNSNDDDSDNDDNNNVGDQCRSSSGSLFADLDGLTVGSLPSHYLRRGSMRRYQHHVAGEGFDAARQCVLGEPSGGGGRRSSPRGMLDGASSSSWAHPRAPYLSSRPHDRSLSSAMPMVRLPESAIRLHGSEAGGQGVQYYGSLRESGGFLDYCSRRQNSLPRQQQQQQQKRGNGIHDIDNNIDNAINDRGGNNSYSKRPPSMDDDTNNVSLLSTSITAIDVLTRIRQLSPTNQQQQQQQQQQHDNEQNNINIIRRSYDENRKQQHYSSSSSSSSTDNALSTIMSTNKLQWRDNDDDDDDDDDDDHLRRLKQQCNPDTEECFDFEL